MHTLLVTLAGLFLLFIIYLFSKRKKVRIFRYFPLIWLIVCGIQLWLALQAGYSLLDELKIYSLVYSIPFVAWLVITEYTKRKTNFL